MAKKFGKRGKPRGQQLPEDPRNMFGPPQLPRPSGPPASSTPLADYLAHGWPGVDSGYVVLPRSLAEGMSLPWQQQLVHLLAQFHEQHGRLTWPIYRVVPSRYERLVDLDEEQLAEAGYLVEIDVGGDMVYRERSGRKVEDPDNTTVLVSCLDPIVPPVARPQARQSAPPSGPVPPPAHQQPAPPQPPPAQPRTPAPMNIGPQPVWHTTRSAAPAPPAESKQAPQTQERAQPARQAQPSTPQAEQRPEPQSRPQQSAPQPNTAPRPQEPSPAPARPAEPARQEPDTPPRGVGMPGAGARGWFDELPESGETAADHGEAKGADAEGEQFGPTGDPTEIPYRYRR
ncbi:hypothetical protein SAMN05216266_11525 [Amycolatopsis marina]|uniref:Uncharacterized protein n=1 Tax=Amycolatopsis marina TaxID=490629 RepID=A0A1I1BMU7_9PSEU|nr:hypothetical protein [Amycolatopsis marina]SFB51122.1 hypothetical protein SAMN05216266_11525 [Amycolatopsis marina]